MERLTVRDPSGVALCPKTGTKACTPELCARCHHQIAIFNRLAEYEDTGLTPELVTTMASDKLEQVTNMLVDTVPQLVQAIVAKLPQLVEVAVNDAVKEVQEG